MQNGKCHLSCLNVLDSAAGKSEWMITCSVDGHTRTEHVDCPFADMFQTPVKFSNPTSVIFHTMNDNSLFKQKGQKQMESNTERHKRVCYELNALYDRKNRDYGDSFHETYQKGGIKTAWLRIHDKFSRFENIVLGKKVPNIADETIRDTLIDLANYAIMTVMELDAETEQPFKARNNGDGTWTKEN